MDPEPPVGEKDEEKKDNGPDEGKKLEENLGEYVEDTQEPKPGESIDPNTPVTVKPIISGYTMLIILDAVLPSLLVKVFGLFSKDFKATDPNKIKLTPNQIKAIEPIADKAAAYLFDGMHPVNALAISLAFTYSGNLIACTKRIEKAH